MPVILQETMGGQPKQPQRKAAQQATAGFSLSCGHPCDRPPRPDCEVCSAFKRLHQAGALRRRGDSGIFLLPCGDRTDEQMEQCDVCKVYCHWKEFDAQRMDQEAADLPPEEGSI